MKSTILFVTYYNNPIPLRGKGQNQKVSALIYYNLESRKAVHTQSSCQEHKNKRLMH